MEGSSGSPGPEQGTFIAQVQTQGSTPEQYIFFYPIAAGLTVYHPRFFETLIA